MANIRMPKVPKSSSIDERSSRQNGKRKMCNERNEKNSKITDEFPVVQKKGRMVWTDELHERFLDAIAEIGFEKVSPKKILDEMEVPGLSRGNVASHLQKFRAHLKKPKKDSLVDSTLPRHFTCDMDDLGLIPTSHPSVTHKHPHGSFQYAGLQQNPPTQPRFGGMPLVGSRQFRYNNVENNTFMRPAIYGQLGPLSNNGHIRRPRISIAPSSAEETFGGYPNYGSGDPMCVDIPNCATNPMQRMVNQQPQGRPEFFPTVPLGQNFDNLNSQYGQINYPYSTNLNARNIGSFRISSPSPTLYPANGYSIGNNYATRQMPYPAAGDVVNPTGAYVGEMSTVDYDSNHMNEILKGMKPMEENMCPSVLNFDSVNTHPATQGDPFVNLEKFQVVPPPQPQLEGQGYNGLLDFTKNTSPHVLNCFFEQGDQSKDQVQQQFGEGQRYGEGILDSTFDISEFMLNSPENNHEQEQLNKDKLDLE